MVIEFIKLFDPIWNLRKQYAKNISSQSASDLHQQEMLFSSDKSNLRPASSMRNLSSSSSSNNNNLLSPEDILIFLQNATIDHFSPTLKLLL